jgi:hypothetical protein
VGRCLHLSTPVILLIYFTSLLECNTVYVGRWVTVFRINLLHPSPGRTSSAGLNTAVARFSETSVYIRWRHIQRTVVLKLSAMIVHIMFCHLKCNHYFVNWRKNIEQFLAEVMLSNCFRRYLHFDLVGYHLPSQGSWFLCSDSAGECQIIAS